MKNQVPIPEKLGRKIGPILKIGWVFGGLVKILGKIPEVRVVQVVRGITES
ncbi:hypothetical protein [Arthrospiribacter ruber]|uniref:hypothetical protein n=1 Tax=Arthrospiribacter ruber TaxID=2487934 RepID=UPI001C5B5CA4|nr:hypothetical protein [Arthrospiribacter ruber]